ncbi:hypothetical protein BV22DRAFT_11266 [Leucogyrophana mollusca]|uniref:Uncharacterized protein n=1 Tax=Leucogyrophana mollusca TaxID=85980 RepID=A0ACB8C1J7_9AGAM|nr:hypothetical protein BV22DRAFT_11266 [Leucogyrophana mollusca]
MLTDGRLESSILHLLECRIPQHPTLAVLESCLALLRNRITNLKSARESVLSCKDGTASVLELEIIRLRHS